MISDVHIADLHRVLLDVPPHVKGRARLVAQHAAALGTTVQTLYARLRRFSGENHAHYRPMPAALREVAIQVSALKTRMMDEGDRSAGTAIILDTLYGNQVPGGYSPSQINRAMKRLGLLLPHPTVLVEPEYANQVWHVDYSVSTTCLLMPDNKTVKIATRRERMTNKRLRQHLEAQRIMIGVVVDGYSRVALARYIPTLGESTPMAINFLKHAMSKRPGDRNPLGGIPDQVYTDNGSWAKTEMFKTFCMGYGIAHQTIAPGRKWENGKAEIHFRGIKSSLETFLALHPGEEFGVEEIGQMLDDYIARQNESKHPVYSRTRQNVYLDGLKIAPPRYLEYDAKPEYRQTIRKVNASGRLSIDTKAYFAGSALAGHKVVVTISGLDVAINDPFTGLRRKIELYEPVKYGEKRMIPATSARAEMYRRRGLDEFAHGDATLTPIEGPLPPTHKTSGAPQEPGDTVEVPDATENVMRDPTEAKLFISKRLAELGFLPLNQLDDYINEQIDTILAVRGAKEETCEEIISALLKGE